MWGNVATNAASLTDTYFFSQKQAMITQLEQQGCLKDQAAAFLDFVAIPEIDPRWVMTFKDNPNYRN